MIERHPRARLIHLPVHASWLNQIELYFSIVQRKVLTPNDFPNLESLTEPLLQFASTTGRSPGRSNAEPRPGSREDRRPRATSTTRGLTTQTSGRLY
jgi:hypothetical protein